MLNIYISNNVNGTLSLSDFSEAMRLGKLGEQVVLKSKKAFEALTFVEATGGTVLQENNGTYTVGPEYWAGWALAYYQWLTRRSFAFMHRKGLGIKEVIAMYYPLHEADISKFVDAADNIAASMC